MVSINRGRKVSRNLVVCSMRGVPGTNDVQAANMPKETLAGLKLIAQRTVECQGAIEATILAAVVPGFSRVPSPLCSSSYMVPLYEVGPRHKVLRYLHSW